jgi:hypothetical protein
VRVRHRAQEGTGITVTRNVKKLKRRPPRPHGSPFAYGFLPE